MLGYTHKNDGEAGFVPYVHGFTNEQIDRGKRAYTLMNCSMLKSRKSISLSGWQKVLLGYWEKHLHPWEGPPTSAVLTMLKKREAYLGDGFCRLGNVLVEERVKIHLKSVFHPEKVTAHDVNYMLFNQLVEVDDDDDDFDDQVDFIAMEDRVGTRRKKRTKWVLPSEFGGNNQTDVVWTNQDDEDFTADELLAHCKRMKLARSGGIYSEEQQETQEEQQQETQEEQQQDTQDSDYDDF